MEIITLKLSEITPDPGNAKEHPEEQIKQIMESIERFGNDDPIAVWGDTNLIVEGHGRYEALKRLGKKTAECIRLDHLTDEERRAYMLVHNQLTMNTGWDDVKLTEALGQIPDIDMAIFGFDEDADDDFDEDEEWNGPEEEESAPESFLYIGSVSLFGHDGDAVCACVIPEETADVLLRKIQEAGSEEIARRLVTAIADL